MSRIKQKTNVLKIQKDSITRNINKCFTLIEKFKQEQDIDSILVTRVAITEKLDEIGTNTSDYIDLCSDTLHSAIS